ncbi:hypothetical protein BOTBODRAFT_36989 [Botryobasidium botryosum FD-172 SS1]|uniref:Nuclear distribution protein PAC1 n=1 Tax=Botryobasidium botryosum (strain FD-172 SS1) TaxID=930990 RepID=A0A067M4E2_BOTB1|nr:hypothetical protein BOTBODRAFT_36989 [Botryobasidium botryosum FD-172 SS1]
MSLALSERQQEDLHKSILDYLYSAGFRQTYTQLKEEIPTLADFQPDANAKTSGLLVKKWTSVIRMQKKIMDLESRLTQALEENSHNNHANGTSKRTNPEWLPSAGSAKHTLTGHRAPLTAVSFHPIYSSLVTASDDATVKIWDWETGELERTLKGHTKAVTDCQYDSRGKSLVTCSYDLFIKLWNIEDGYSNFATLRGHEHSVSSARFLPGDTRIVSSSRDRTIRIWEIASTHCIKVIRSHDEWIRCALPSADGRFILTCSNDHTSRIIDAESGATKAEMKGHQHVIEVAVFAPRAATPAILELISQGQSAGSRYAKVDAQSVLFIATGSRDKTVKLWDALRGQCVWTLTGHDNWVRALVFHPSGKYLLSAADDYTYRVWDLKTGRCLRRIEAHDHFVSCMAWGRQVVSGEGSSADALQDGTSERVLNVIATGSSDKTVKVWLP